jgi:hypothetical protein
MAVVAPKNPHFTLSEKCSKFTKCEQEEGEVVGSISKSDGGFI